MMKNIRNGVQSGRLFADTPRNTEKLFSIQRVKFLWAGFSGNIFPKMYQEKPDNKSTPQNTSHVNGLKMFRSASQRGTRGAMNANLEI